MRLIRNGVTDRLIVRDLRGFLEMQNFQQINGFL